MIVNYKPGFRAENNACPYGANSLELLVVYDQTNLLLKCEPGINLECVVNTLSARPYGPRRPF